jgi:hypothetical protein
MSKKIEDQVLQERQVKALEKIAGTLDTFTLWFEEIDKEEWGERIAWYLDLWKKKYIDEETGDNSSVQE